MPKINSVSLKFLRDAHYNGAQWVMGPNVLSTNLNFEMTFEKPIQTEIRLLVFPRELGAENIAQALSISITAPLPVWLKWLPVALLVVVGGGIAIRRLWPQPLLGEVAWQYSGRNGQAKLTGRILKLAALQIPGWQPTRIYVLRNKNGHRVFSESGVEMELSHKKTFRLEGVTFTYLNEAEAL